MAEAQAIARVHRIGQIQKVSVTRYIVQNSIEGVSTINTSTSTCTR
jgi:SNF2 family DNA or RNA helicase